MDKSKESIAKDLFPRVLGIILFAIITWITTSFLNQTDKEKWINTLKLSNNEAIVLLGNTFNRRLELAENLAEDKRLSSLFSDDFALGDLPSKLARRSMYEFKYVNEIDHSYIFSTVYGEIILSSAGSPPLPNKNLEPFYNAAKNKIEKLTNLTTIGGQSYVLLANAIRNDIGKIVGYAMYTDSTKSFFKDIAPQLKKYSDVDFNAYMLEADENTALSIEKFTLRATSLRNTNRNDALFPIFEDNFSPQKFIINNTAEVFAVGGFILDRPKWKITSSIDTRKISSDSDDMRLLLFCALLLGIIILFLVPLNGPYTNALNRVYSNLNIKKSNTNQPTIDLNSIDRMRISSPPLGATTQAERDLNKKINEENKPKPKEDYRPSDAVIAYNIRTGMKNKRIKLMYQPIFSVNTNKVEMHEVYLRIVEENGDIMSPDLWLPVAKSEDLFSLIDETVVCVAVEKFFIQPIPLETPLAFNISGNTFGSLEFLQKLMSSADSAKHIAQSTIFELHSKEIIEDKRAMNFIKDCREMGFRFSIDYFGGGPQTLKAAKTLKFDYVKIDVLGFNLDTAAGQKEFIKLIKTAEAIDLKIIVEKIEDERTLRFCKKIGVLHVQGYHLAEPAVELHNS